MILVTAGLCQAEASEAETIDAINKASAALDAAFAQKDVEAIKGMMTPDHISVTPYYDGPQSVADQLASLPELDFGEIIQGEVTVALLDSDAAMRTFTTALHGSFKGTSAGACVRHRNPGEARWELGGAILPGDHAEALRPARLL